MRHVLAVIIVSLAAVVSPCQQPTAPVPGAPQRLTIESIFAEGGITGRGPETIKWSPDATKVSFVQRDDSGEHGQLWYIDVVTGRKAVLVAESKLQSLAPPASSIKDERQREWMQRYSVAAYQWAPDSEHLLFDSRGQLWYYTLETGTAVQLTASPDASTDAKFSPDGKRLAYVRKHDLWVRPVEGGGAEKKITAGGDANLLNGEVDWVYAEELAVRSNYFWSPDGRHIAFLQMNEKPVPTYPITEFLAVHASASEQKYPQAGDPNPEVRVGVVGSDGGKVRWASVGEEKDKNILIPRFGWVREGLLYMIALNRLQTRIELYFVDAASGRSRLMLAEDEPEAWISDVWDDRAAKADLYLLGSGDGFTWPSWRDGYTQLYLYSFDKANPLAAEAKLERQLTKGEFEVSELAAVDESGGQVYFTANADDPRQQQLYAVPLAGGLMRQISEQRGTHSPTFPKTGAQYFVDSYSATMIPPRLSLCKVGGTCNIFWQARAVDQFRLIAPQALELKAADKTTTLYGSLLLPPGAEDIRAPSASSGQALANTGPGRGAQPGKKFPLLLNPYGGPGIQTVRDAWGGAGFLFQQIMARAGFAVLQVDNRGMGGRGKKFALPLRHQFGTVELQDQLAALDEVLSRYPMLDKDRLGWWGWSYGGYMTLYAMTHADRFKAGVSGAPVTDWRLYDSIYTERYMGLPGDNAAGYSASSPVFTAAALSGRLLEVHGTSDDNVHMQNTIQMIRNLILAGKQFDLQLYPGKTHGITGTRERSQLYHRIQQHFEHWVKGTEATPAPAQ